MSRPLVIIGGGGHARSVIDAAVAAGREVRGILERPGAQSGDIPGVPVLGGDELIYELARTCDFLVGVGSVGSMAVRERLHQSVIAAGGTLAVLVAPSAYVSATAALGPGTVVLRNAVVGPGAEIGAGCIINTGAIVEHDAVVEDFCHVATGAILNGAARLGRSSMVGSRSVVLQCVSVAPETVIGAGAVVTRNINLPGVYVGAPARPKRSMI